MSDSKEIHNITPQDVRSKPVKDNRSDLDERIDAQFQKHLAETQETLAQIPSLGNREITLLSGVSNAAPMSKPTLIARLLAWINQKISALNQNYFNHLAHKKWVEDHNPNQILKKIETALEKDAGKEFPIEQDHIDDYTGGILDPQKIRHQVNIDAIRNPEGFETNLSTTINDDYYDAIVTPLLEKGATPNQILKALSLFSQNGGILLNRHLQHKVTAVNDSYFVGQNTDLIKPALSKLIYNEQTGNIKVIWMIKLKYVSSLLDAPESNKIVVAHGTYLISKDSADVKGTMFYALENKKTKENKLTQFKNRSVQNKIQNTLTHTIGKAGEKQDGTAALFVHKKQEAVSPKHPPRETYRSWKEEIHPHEKTVQHKSEQEQQIERTPEQTRDTWDRDLNRPGKMSSNIALPKSENIRSSDNIWNYLTKVHGRTENTAQSILESVTPNGNAKGYFEAVIHAQEALKNGGFDLKPVMAPPSEFNESKRGDESDFSTKSHTQYEVRDKSGTVYGTLSFTQEAQFPAGKPPTASWYYQFDRIA